MRKDDLTMSEQLNIEENFKTPHLSYILETIQERKRVAYLILQKLIEEVLLIDSSGFLIDSVFAGLSEKHIEYIAKHGLQKQKENVLKILQDAEMMKGVWEIVKDMDDDLGGGATTNQQRVKKVMQYISDNRIAFQF